MNDLFSTRSFTRPAGGGPATELQPPAGGGADLDKFFQDVQGIKQELTDIESLHKSLQAANEASKTLHDAAAVRSHRRRMDGDVATALKKAKLIKLRLESLDRANAANRTLPGCGPGSSTDRTRTSVVAGLRTKLRDAMQSFSLLRQTISHEYRDTVGRRFFAVTGKEADEDTLDALISSGEAETMVQRAIQEGGQGEVMAVVTEIKERYDAVTEIERSLEELHQVFMDMAVMVAAQGEQINDIESQVNRASSFVRVGAQELVSARKNQKNARKWTVLAIVLVLIIVLVIVLPIVIPRTKSTTTSP
ncbi:syntaxin-121-like [Wolffia australiana]